MIGYDEALTIVNNALTINRDGTRTTYGVEACHKNITRTEQNSRFQTDGLKKLSKFQTMNAARKKRRLARISDITPWYRVGLDGTEETKKS